MTYVKESVVFKSGWRGTQTVEVDYSGKRTLVELVLTHRPDGDRCQHVFHQRPDVAARVYDLAGLAPYGPWHVA